MAKQKKVVLEGWVAAEVVADTVCSDEDRKKCWRTKDSGCGFFITCDGCRRVRVTIEDCPKKGG